MDDRRLAIDHRPSSIVPSWLYASRADWLALALYVGLAVVFTWPLAANFNNSILGHGNDGWQVVWDIWWMGEAISTGTPPYHFTSVYSPWGTTNYLHLLNPLWGILTLPVQWAFGPIVAYNLACWLSLIMLAFAGYLLGRDVTGSRLAGFVTGLGTAYTPHQMAQYLGHLDVASMQYSVLALWCLYRGLARSGSLARTAAWLLWAAALLAISALTHPYALFVALIGMLLLGLYRTLANIHLSAWWHYQLKTIAAISIGLLVAAPLLLSMLGQLQGPDAPRRTGGLAAGDISEVKFFSTDLVAYMLPNPFHPLWGESASKALDAIGGAPIERTGSLGYCVLALALVGVVAPQTRRRAVLWWALALVGVALSLGPVVRAGGSDTGIWSPAALLWSLPDANMLRVPGRLVTVAALGVAVCAGLGLISVLGWVRASRRRPIAVLACLAIGFEFLSAPYPTARWNVDPWFYKARDAGVTGSLLMVPFFANNTLPLRWQMASGIPLVGGYLSRKPAYPLTDGVPPFVELGLNRNAFLPPFERAAGTLCRPLPAESTYLDILRLANVRYVAVDATYTSEDDPRIATARRMFPGGPVHSNGPLAIYDTGGGDPPASIFGVVEDTEDWLPVEEGRFRWTAQNYARFHIWSGAERTARLRLKLESFAGDRNIAIAVGDKTLATGRAGREGVTFDLEWEVPKGFSALLITADGRPVTPASLGMGNDYRPLVMRFSECSYSAEN